MAKTTKSQARTKRERSEFLWGWLFILPTTIGLIVLNIIPIFQTIYQSFFKTGDCGKGNIFIGLQNHHLPPDGSSSGSGSPGMEMAVQL